MLEKTPDEIKKAYKVWLEQGEGSTVVFAKNRNEAKVIAMGCDCFEDAQYIDISVKRMKDMDRLYKGKSEIDWYDHETRLTLVRDHSWSCFEPSWECDNCVAKKHCVWGEEMKNPSEIKNELNSIPYELHMVGACLSPATMMKIQTRIANTLNYIEQLESNGAQLLEKAKDLTIERDEALGAICDHCMDIPCQENECYWYRKMNQTEDNE